MGMFFPLVLSCPGCERELACCCLSSDSKHYVLKEKNCASVSECGISGQKRAAGLVFTYTTRCCHTDLCNAATTTQTVAPCWILGGTVLAIKLASVWNHARTHTHLTLNLKAQLLVYCLHCNWQECSRTRRHMRQVFWGRRKLTQSCVR